MSDPTALTSILAGPLRTALTMLVLPPVPFLALAGWGALRAWRARRGGLSMVAAAIALMWLSQCDAVADALQASLQPPAALGAAERDALAARVRAGEHVAILVLGGGVAPDAREYGGAHLAEISDARLHYGLWLAKETGAPLGMTGGVGPGQVAGAPAEALVGAREVLSDAGVSLRWIETASTTTKENAGFAMPMLARDGVRDVWIVTHAWHMKRALRDFERAAAALPGPRIVVHPATMGWGQAERRPALRWLPSPEADFRVRAMLREWLGWIAGA